MQISSADPLADLFLNNAPEDEVIELDTVDEVDEGNLSNTNAQENRDDPLGNALSNTEEQAENQGQETSSPGVAENTPSLLKDIPAPNTTSSSKEDSTEKTSDITSSPETTSDLSASDIQKEIFQKTTPSLTDTKDNTQKITKKDKKDSPVTPSPKVTTSSFRASSQGKKDKEKKEVKVTNTTHSIPFNTGIKPSPAWLAQQKSASKRSTASQESGKKDEELHGAARQIPKSGASEMIWLLLSGILAGGVSFARRKKIS